MADFHRTDSRRRRKFPRPDSRPARIRQSNRGSRSRHQPNAPLAPGKLTLAISAALASKKNHAAKNAGRDQTPAKALESQPASPLCIPFAKAPPVATRHPQTTRTAGEQEDPSRAEAVAVGNPDSNRGADPDSSGDAEPNDSRIESRHRSFWGLRQLQTGKSVLLRHDGNRIGRDGGNANRSQVHLSRAVPRQDPVAAQNSGAAADLIDGSAAPERNIATDA